METVGVVHLVVLDCSLKVTTKKVVNFFRKKVHPQTKSWVYHTYVGITARLLLLQLSNIANLTCVVCGVQTTKITIIFYINTITDKIT